jgi:calcineurin-like phosphoesterase family protein
MSKIYFTADCHFNHANIIIYANRPFLGINDLIPNSQLWVSQERKNQRALEMDTEIIKRWNDKVKSNDLVYHIGDFCFKGNTFKYYESKLNGKIVHIIGNHDYNNGIKSLITKAIMEFGNRVFLIQHHPPTTPLEIPDYVDCVLCGHVHNHWKHAVLDSIPIINVGVDVWGFTPISIESILKFIKQLKREGKI